MRPVFTICLLASLGCGGGDPVAKERKTLAGSWKLASAEQGGKAVPKDEVLDISFTAHPDGKSDVRVPGDEFQTTSVIDPSKTPKTIDIEYLGGKFKGQKQYGIYKIEGDRWTVFSTPPGGKPEDRPRSFDSKTAEGAVLVWQRVKEGK